MPSGKHEVHVNVPIEKTWDFVSQMNNLAPLVPRYVDHTIINHVQSIWILHADIGLVQKNIKLKVTITEWKSPSKIAFTLVGVHESISGSGYFKARKINEQETKVTGYMKISTKGIMSPIINNVLKTYLPKITITFTEKVKENMLRKESIPINT